MDSLAKIRSAGWLFITRPWTVVPYGLGRRLFDAAGSRRLLEIPGAAHNDTDVVGGHQYFDAVGASWRSAGSGRGRDPALSLDR
jgi:hypothetical protein